MGKLPMLVWDGSYLLVNGILGYYNVVMYDVRKPEAELSEYLARHGFCAIAPEAAKLIEDSRREDISPAWYVLVKDESAADRQSIKWKAVISTKRLCQLPHVMEVQDVVRKDDRAPGSFNMLCYDDRQPVEYVLAQRRYVFASWREASIFESDRTQGWGSHKPIYLSPCRYVGTIDPHIRQKYIKCLV